MDWDIVVVACNVYGTTLLVWVVYLACAWCGFVYDIHDNCLNM